jgi:hypothetical protein
MPTKFAKGDEVRVDAKRFDGEGDLDELGLKFSERWLRDGDGVWCYGKISFVFKKQSRQTQKYRIKYHEGPVMECLEADIEMAPEEEEAQDETSSEEVGEELSVDDREDDEGFQRQPLERYEDGQEEGDDGHVELESESDNDEVSLYPQDIAMLHWIYIAPCCLPHASIIKRIPQSKGSEMKIITLNTALP